MDIPILQNIVVILALAVVINLLFQRLRIPTILGFLITGIVAGPKALNIVSAGHEVELLSEIGIIFLLFVIGIEFSLKSLISIKRTVIVGGIIQVFGTIGVIYLAARLGGLSINESVFMGFLFSLSSTAIVLKMLQEMGEIASPHGRISIAILIFQDIVVVPMMLLTPILGGGAEDIGITLLIMGIKVVVVIALVVLLARYLVPVIFRAVVRTRSSELFILTVVLLCFSTAWLTSTAGLSLALGAFFAGLIISESDYSHQATANILPFREIFISFFFVSVGMLLDLSFFIEHIVSIHAIAFGVIFIKMAVIAIAVFILGYPPRIIILSALSLFQVGEFAFLLSSTGMQYGLMSDLVYQYFLAVSIITMGATPFVILFSSKISDRMLKTPLPVIVRQRMKSITKKRTKSEENPIEKCHDHLVIIGYGINGENVAKTAKRADIPYIIIDMNSDTIEQAKAKGEPIVFGDASDNVILKHVQAQDARVVVVAISDPKATKQIVSRVRAFTDTAYVIVRTRYVREIEELIKLGADEVIPEEFETSIEIFSRVLKKYLVPSHEILEFVNRIRASNYDALRTLSPLKNVQDRALHIPDMEIATLSVHKGSNRVVGKSILESKLRSEFGITILAIKRGKEYLTQIEPTDKVKQEDILFVFGRPDDVARLNEHFALDGGANG